MRLHCEHIFLNYELLTFDLIRTASVDGIEGDFGPISALGLSAYHYDIGVVHADAGGGLVAIAGARTAVIAR